MKTLDTYIGIEPFTVLVDDSPQLGSLVEQARQLRTLPFAERLEAVKHFALEAMVNAYEQMIVWGHKKTEEEGVKRLVQEADITDDMEVEKIDGPMIKGWRDVTALNEAQRQHQRFYDIVFQHHPLSYALEQKAGCCRYQGALFFVLGYEADLGDKHFIQAAPVNSRANSVFNELVNGGKSQVVSIFTESLQDKSLDYSKQNPRIFEEAFEHVPGLNLYSYHRTPSGLVMVENPEKHVKVLESE